MKLFLIFLFIYPVKFKLKAPYAKKVLIAGDFTDWDKNPVEMEKKGEIWEKVVELEPGRYEYKFIVDGKWISDPENPLKVGPYGNSVIEITEKGEVIIPKSLSNTEWNPSVKFSGDMRFYLNLEDTLKKFTTTGDAKLDLKGYLTSNSILWVRLRYNNENLNNEGAIPVYIERSEFSLRERNISFRGFYNKFVLSSLEPFDLTGKIGEFHKDFGREEEGFIFNYRTSLSKFLFLYSNGWKEGRDFIFGRINFKNFISFNYLRKKGFDRSYNTYSPDSLSEGDSLIFFNSYKIMNFLSSDINKKIKNLDLKIAYGRGDILWRADEKSNGEKFEHQVKMSDFSRFFTSISYKGNFEIWSSFEYDYHNLGKYSGNYKEGLLLLSFFFKRGDLRILLKNYGFDVSSDKSFSNLFYFSRLSQLMYFETFSLGFKNLFSSIINFKMPFIPLYFECRFSSPFIFYSPNVSEFILKLNKRFFGNYEIYSDLRFIIFDAPHLKIRNSFFSPYIEIKRYVFENSFIFVSYGLDPYTLDEDEWNRRLYLEQKGADISLIKDSYLRYGRSSIGAERDLSNLILIRLGAEIRF